MDAPWSLALPDDVRRLMDDLDALAVYVPWMDGTYTRTSLHRREDGELVALAWAPGTRSAIHDHDGVRGFVHIVRGRLESHAYRVERDGDRLHFERGETAVLRAGDADAGGTEHDIHRVIAPERTLSLHWYARPIEAFTVYDDRRSTATRVGARYDRRFASSSVSLRALVAAR